MQQAVTGDGNRRRIKSIKSIKHNRRRTSEEGFVECEKIMVAVLERLWLQQIVYSRGY